MNCKDYQLFNRVGSLLETHRWIFAKTMPHNPHHYTLRKEWDDKDFLTVVRFIRQYGYSQIYNRRHYTVLNVNSNFYWTMGAPLDQTILINRKPLLRRCLYDQIAPVYDQFFTDDYSLHENQAVINMLGDVREKSVLDIGCGTGLFLDYCTPKQYTGIDVSYEMISVLKSKHPTHANYIINTSLDDFCTNHQYDLIIALFGTASYLTPCELSRIPQLLSPNGYAFLMFYQEGYYPITYEKSGISLVDLIHRHDLTSYNPVLFNNYAIGTIQR